MKDLKKLKKCKTEQRAESTYRYLLLAAKINQFITESLMEIEMQSKITYLIPSIFLYDSFAYLNQQAAESLHFVTGPEIGEIKTLDKIVDLKLEEQSVVYAKADSLDVKKVLIYLAEYKFKLWGYFHIHPGYGAMSTLPSGTDLKLELRLNKGGYRAVGAIFSRDGFIRFFSPGKYKIQIYGEGVQKINDKLFYLSEISQISDQGN